MIKVIKQKPLHKLPTFLQDVKRRYNEYRNITNAIAIKAIPTAPPIIEITNPNPMAAKTNETSINEIIARQDILIFSKKKRFLF
jgi:hypothetical protein